MMVQNFYFNSSYVLMCIKTWISLFQDRTGKDEL